MKKCIYINMFITLASLLLMGCREITVTTLIHKDGSCERVMLVRSDSIDFFKQKYPIPIDSTWSLTVAPDTTEHGKFIYTARKTFASVALLNDLYIKDTSNLGKLGRNVSLNKQFRWFYTFFTYKETYTKIFEGPALSTYLDTVQVQFNALDEAEKENYLKANFDTTQAKLFQEKFDEKYYGWVFETIFNTYYKIFKEQAVKLKSPMLSPEILDAKKDTLYKLSCTKLESSDDFLGYSAQIYGTDTVISIKKVTPYPFQEVDGKMKALNQLFPAEIYKNVVEMPGMVTESNALTNPGDTLAWIVKWDNFLTEDYEMHVTSKVKNTWAIMVTCIVAGIALFGMAFRGLLKRKKLN